MSNRRNNLPSSIRRHLTASSVECALRREDRVNESWRSATRKLSTPKGALWRGEETAGGAVTANPTGCIMQRLFKVRPIRPLSSRRFALFSLPPFLRTLLARTTRRMRGYTAGEMPLARTVASRRRKDVEGADISRYKGKRFTAKWIDYSVSRSRERIDDC